VRRYGEQEIERSLLAIGEDHDPGAYLGYPVAPKEGDPGRVEEPFDLGALGRADHRQGDRHRSEHGD
jgi:hypothetical protein